MTTFFPVYAFTESSSTSLYTATFQPPSGPPSSSSDSRVPVYTQVRHDSSDNYSNPTTHDGWVGTLKDRSSVFDNSGDAPPAHALGGAILFAVDFTDGYTATGTGVNWMGEFQELQASYDYAFAAVNPVDNSTTPANHVTVHGTFSISYTPPVYFSSSPLGADDGTPFLSFSSNELSVSVTKSAGLHITYPTSSGTQNFTDSSFSHNGGSYSFPFTFYEGDSTTEEHLRIDARNQLTVFEALTGFTDHNEFSWSYDLHIGTSVSR